MRTVAMIPVKRKSTRCKNKNYRMFADTTLADIAIQKALECFDKKDIYINSRDMCFKRTADAYGIRFHKRSSWKSEKIETNDDFLYDFLKKVKCDYVIQINTTSPFTVSGEIYSMKKFIEKYDYDAIFSVQQIKSHCIFRGNIPLNFSFCEKMKQTQDMESISVFTNGIMGWKRKTAMENMKKHGACVYGCWSKKMNFALYPEIRAFDIDTEEDFKIAEILYRERSRL